MRKDATFHTRMASFRDASRGLALLYEGMTKYLAEVPDGKMFHDPLAATLIVERERATWTEVRAISTHGEWGAAAAEGTGTFITVAIDHERFFRVLTQTVIAPTLAKNTTN